MTDPVRDELTWAARALGGPRDEEVADELLAGMLADQPSDLVVGPVRRRLGAELRGSRRTMRRQTLEVLESQRYVDLLRSLDDLVADPPWTDVAARPAREALPRLLRKDWTRVVRRARTPSRWPGRQPTTPPGDVARPRKGRLRRGFSRAGVRGRGDPARGTGAEGQSVLGQHPTRSSPGPGWSRWPRRPSRRGRARSPTDGCTRCSRPAAGLRPGGGAGRAAGAEAAPVARARWPAGTCGAPHRDQGERPAARSGGGTS